MADKQSQDLDARIGSLCQVVETHRAEIARLRRLPDAVARSFVDADVYRLLVPADLGGAGLDPLHQFECVERVAYHEASAGWNFAVGSGLGLFSGFMEPATVATLYARESAAMAGSGAPQGRAHRVAGGYRVEGRFGWASGIDQAHWVYGGCHVYDNGQPVLDEGGRPLALMAFTPKADAVIHDAWQVSGLVATNSTEFSLHDVFVPADRTVGFPWRKRLHAAPLFRLPPTFFGFALTGAPLGVARRAIDGLRTLGIDKPTPAGVRLGDTGFAQYAIAKADALVDSSRVLVREAFQAIWAPVVAGDEASLAVRARLRRACVHAAEASMEAVTLCHRAAGGSALFAAAPFDAALRDVAAMCGHMVFQRTMMEDAGRVAFGRDPILAIF